MILFNRWKCMGTFFCNLGRICSDDRCAKVLLTSNNLLKSQRTIRGWTRPLLVILPLSVLVKNAVSAFLRRLYPMEKL